MSDEQSSSPCTVFKRITTIKRSGFIHRFGTLHKSFRGGTERSANPPESPLFDIRREKEREREREKERERERESLEYKRSRAYVTPR